MFDDGTCEFEPVVVEDEDLESYNPDVEIDLPEVTLEDVDVDVDIPAGGLDVPEGTEVTVEVSEASEEELQNIIDDSSSSDAEVEVYAGISFDAFDDDGNEIELVEGATLDVELTFDSARTEFDLSLIHISEPTRPY